MKRRTFLKLSALTAAYNAQAEESLNLFAQEKVVNTEDSLRQEMAFLFDAEQGSSSGGADTKVKALLNTFNSQGHITNELALNAYPMSFPKSPDNNPSTSATLLAHSQTLYEQNRLLYPLKRVGERGEGNWQRLSWDEALEEIAKKIFECMNDAERGPSKLLVQTGNALEGSIRKEAALRFAALLGAVVPNTESSKGCLQTGNMVAYGQAEVGCESDFFCEADTLIFWGQNPAVTKSAEAHFIAEAKYKGTKVIVISPEYSKTAQLADLWVPIKAQTDNILAMSMIHEIIEQKLYKTSFIKQFTDLVCLVRKDTNKLLCRSDVEKNVETNAKEEFYCYDELHQKPVLLAGSRGSAKQTLRLEGTNPALETEVSVTLASGEEVLCESVFSQLKRQSRRFKAESIASYIGVSANIIKKLARDIALDKVVSISLGTALSKQFHGTLTTWNIASLCGLTGRLGPYGGINTSVDMYHDIDGALSNFAQEYKYRKASGFLQEFMLGNAQESLERYFNDNDLKRAQKGLNKNVYSKILGAMLNDSESAKKESLKPWWQVDTAFIVAHNAFAKNSASSYKKSFFEKVKYLVCVDTYMSETALEADIVLPAKTAYDSYDLRVDGRYASVSRPVTNVKVVGEALDEWQIFTALAKKIEELSLQDEYKEQTQIADDKHYCKNEVRDLSLLYKNFTNHFFDDTSTLDTLQDSQSALHYLFNNTDALKAFSFEKSLKKQKVLPLEHSLKTSSPLYSDRAYNSFEHTLFLYKPFNTLTGRQTFYVEHPLWQRMGMSLNTAKLPLRSSSVGFNIINAHSNYRINTTYANTASMQKLQRAEPVVIVNTTLAKELELKEQEKVILYNTLGSFIARVKSSSKVSKEDILLEHGWDTLMFDNKQSAQNVFPPAINLAEMAEGWGHLRFEQGWDGNRMIAESKVQIEKYKGKENA